MPETYDNTNRGVLFPQDAESERHPNLTGRIDVNGTEYRLAAWKRESKAGNPYLSLTVSEVQPKQDDDDIAF
jgi:hypothetical protein